MTSKCVSVNDHMVTQSTDSTALIMFNLLPAQLVLHLHASLSASGPLAMCQTLLQPSGFISPSCCGQEAVVT